MIFIPFKLKFFSENKGDSFSVSASWITEGLNSEKCLPFKYYYRFGNIWKYGFFCPWTQSVIGTTSFLQITNFVFPYQNGKKMPADTYGAWSNKDGSLVSFKVHDNTNEELTAGIISFLNIIFKKKTFMNIGLIGNGVSPPLKKNHKNNRVLWSFITTNPIPLDGKIKIKFEASTWKFIPSATDICSLKGIILANNRVHTCTITVNTNTDLIFTLSSAETNAFPAGTYILIL